MAKMTAVLLTPDDARALQELLRRERAQSKNTRGRPRTDLNLDPGIAPEVYLIRAPSGGIPASAEIGTGTGTGDDVNWAECDVYRTFDDVPEETGVTRKVYNLGSSDVDAGTFRLAHRDKWGAWYVDGAGSGSGGLGTGARVYLDSDQTIGGSSTLLSFAVTDVFGAIGARMAYDTGGHFDAGTPNRLSVSEAGVYLVGGEARWTASTSGGRQVEIRCEGTGATPIAVGSTQASDGSFSFGHGISTVFKAAGATFFQMAVFQNSGSNKTLQGRNGTTNTRTVFWIHRIG